MHLAFGTRKHEQHGVLRYGAWLASDLCERTNYVTVARARSEMKMVLDTLLLQFTFECEDENVLRKHNAHSFH